MDELAKLIQKLNLLIMKHLFLSISLLVILLISIGNATNNKTCISTCLGGNNIANFTMLPDYHDHLVHFDDDGDHDFMFYDLLDFSIQNLRFTKSSVPKPGVIVMPESKEQVVKAVQCSRKCFLEIRVRCGGHSYEATSSVVTDGSPFVIIDLMNLDGVTVDLESQMAWVEGGATLGQTYYAISEVSKGLGFSAGSCPTVGIGGHISGGGFGLLSRKYGLAADNVVDAILIDAEGRILDRNAMGEEVFWAIRGGGGGVWGIVYAWKIKLVVVPQVVTAFVVSRPSIKVPNLVYKWQHIAHMLPESFYLSCFIGAGLPGAKTAGISATFKGFYLGNKREAMSILSSVFPQLKLKENECNEMNWIESVVYFSGFDSSGDQSISNLLTNRLNPIKNFFKAKSDYVQATLPRTAIISAIKTLEKEPKGYVILDPYGGIMQNITKESIPFPHRKGILFTIQYLVEWQEEEDDEKSQEYIDWIRRFYSLMTPYVSDSPRLAYINYIDFDLGQLDSNNLVMPGNNPSDDAVEKARAWGEKYFLGNYDRLVHAKTLIDPLNIFKHQQGIPPLPIAKPFLTM